MQVITKHTHVHTATQIHKHTPNFLSCVIVGHLSVHTHRSSAEIYNCLFTFKPQQQQTAERRIDFAGLCVCMCSCPSTHVHAWRFRQLCGYKQKCVSDVWSRGERKYLILYQNSGVILLLYIIVFGIICVLRPYCLHRKLMEKSYLYNLFYEY